MAVSAEFQVDGSFEMDLDSCDVEHRGDGAILVRVHSDNKNGRRLPDAVFTFRSGDPQYEYWLGRLSENDPVAG